VSDQDASERRAPTDRHAFVSFLRYFLGLGTWGFGGPIASVGYVQRDLVERRGWLDRQDFLNGVALGQTMPGPLATQVVMWVGYLEAGRPGRSPLPSLSSSLHSCSYSRWPTSTFATRV
jgi:chromate transporter